MSQPEPLPLALRLAQRRALARQGLMILALFAMLGLAAAWVLEGAQAELQARGAHIGFDVFLDPAGFQVGEGWFVAESNQALWRTFVVGALNTLRVAVPAIALTTLMGLLLGVGQLVKHPLIRAICTAYVELVRNVPLLVQMLMVYLALTHGLPDTDHVWQPLSGWFLSKGGLNFPWPVWDGNGWPGAMDWPKVGRFNVSGGAALTPEYLAVFITLAWYTAAFVAETVRAGVQSVPQGQWDAARALGLTPSAQMRFVILPQAWRVIVPSLGNQYLSLIKNSSLGVAVGYPDLVSVTHTALNQTGRSLECIVVMMAVYLGISLLTALAVNLYNLRSMRWARRDAALPASMLTST